MRLQKLRERQRAGSRAETNEADRIAREYERRKSDIPLGRYSPTAPAEFFMRQSRERAALRLLAEAGMLPLGERRIVEVGCGTGGWLPTFEAWGAARGRLAGIDLLPEDSARAAERLAPVRDEAGALAKEGADIRAGDARRLPWHDDAFDVLVLSTVFSSILDPEMRRAIAGEVDRVVGPGGVVLWFDFMVDNPRNSAVRGVRKSELEALFGGFRLQGRRIIPAPPLLRWMIRGSWFVAQALEQLRLLNTHLVAVLRRD